MSRRAQITLTPAEQLELLESERVVVVSSIGPRGWPHSMPMWFVLREGGEIRVWTYAKSQRRCWSRPEPSMSSCEGCRSRPKQS